MLLLAAAGGVQSQSRVRIVRVSFLTPNTILSPPVQTGARRWTQVMLNEPIVAGDWLRTGPGGALEIQLDCGSALRLAQNSAMRVQVLSLGPKGLPVTRVAVEQGRAFFSMRRADSADFRIVLPRGTVDESHGNARFQIIVAAQPPSATVSVSNGRIGVEVNGTAYPLKNSERLAWNSAGAPQRSKAVKAKDPYAKWSQDRDNAFDRSLLLDEGSQFAGAEVAAPPGSTMATTGTPQPEWNAQGFPPPPQGYFVNQQGKWATISDLPTSPEAAGTGGIEVPACAHN